MSMPVVEQHVIKPSHVQYQALHGFCVAAKNLYNAGNYLLRQQVIGNEKAYQVWYRRMTWMIADLCRPLAHKPRREFMTRNALQAVMKSTSEFQALPAKVAQMVINNLYDAWQAFFAASMEYKANPQRFRSRPRLPNYLPKTGAYTSTWTQQAVGLKGFKSPRVSRNGTKVYNILLSGIPGVVVTTTIPHAAIRQIRVVPNHKRGTLTVEIIHIKEIKEQPSEVTYHAAVDIGLDVLAAVTSDKPGFQPALVNGRPCKSINQYYNKKRARLQQALPASVFTSSRLQRLELKRHHKIRDYMHRASTAVVRELVQYEIQALVVGKNLCWKTGINIGSRNNQGFVAIPHAIFIAMLQYKCAVAGITFQTIGEAYTSKCSFLDAEEICKHDRYAGRRRKRSVFTSRAYGNIHADVNASYNILEKAFHETVYRKWTEGVVVHPRRLRIA